LRNRLLASQGGFTLLEVLIAMAIMIMTLASIMSVESSSINASAKAKQLNVVAMLAKNRMVKLEYEFESKTFDEFAKSGSGTFEAPYNDYQWKFEVKEIKFPQLNVGGTPGSNGVSDTIEQMTSLVTKFLSDAIREVSVTISWQRSGKDQSFSIATYWVDLNHEFSLSQQ
jgi:type II secretion system protein I